MSFTFFSCHCNTTAGAAKQDAVRLTAKYGVVMTTLVLQIRNADPQAAPLMQGHAATVRGQLCKCSNSTEPQMLACQASKMFTPLLQGTCGMAMQFWAFQ